MHGGGNPQGAPHGPAGGPGSQPDLAPAMGATSGPSSSGGREPAYIPTSERSLPMPHWSALLLGWFVLSLVLAVVLSHMILLDDQEDDR